MKNVKAAWWALAGVVAGAEIGWMIWTLPPRKLPLPQPQPQRYTVCAIAGAENCWQVGPSPEICPFGPPCWRDGRPVIHGARHLQISRA